MPRGRWFEDEYGAPAGWIVWGVIVASGVLLGAGLVLQLS